MPSWMVRLSAPIAKMRSASRPSSRRDGMPSRNAMSSSIVMRRKSSLAPSWHQLVAAAFGDQDRGRTGILLDLLAQPVDMGFQGMRGDAGVIAPHFLQQHLARDRPLPGAIEVAQDRGFLFGEADLVALRVQQQ